MPVGALVEAGALLGIEENNIRVSLDRLYALDRVERDERGRYPLLPEEILDPAPPSELLSTMKVYDRIGRDHWAGFLARHDVPHRASPFVSRTGAIK